MPSRKPPPEPPWQVILEDMRSHNRTTIEAVEATRIALEQRIDRLDQDSRARDAVLEAAIRDLRRGVEQNTADIRENSADIRGLAARVEELARLEARVSALERRSE